jgi:hypothetical protein
MPDIDLRLDVAGPIEWGLCAGMIARFHYLGTFPDPRCMPLVYSVRLRGEWIGALVYGRSESNRCYQGELTYGSREDVRLGRAKWDRWEVLSLARVWLVPALQSGGDRCNPDTVPGFVDRKGIFRSTLASTVVGLSIERIRLDYLLMYPPCFLGEPYQIRVVSSYCDTRRHRGTLYRASGFALARTNRDGIETWCYDRVPPLDDTQDAEVRRASRHHDRSRRKRAARGAPDLMRYFPFGV